MCACQEYRHEGGGVTVKEKDVTNFKLNKHCITIEIIG